MSQQLLQKSKLLCFFKLSPQINNSQQHTKGLPVILFHFHYPVIYYPFLFNQFRALLPSNITQNHIRMVYKDNVLPNDLPLGLFVSHQSIIHIKIAQLPSPSAYSLMMLSWKRGYTIINRDGGCDHVFKKLQQPQKKKLFDLHVKGHSHGLHQATKYEGNAIAIKIFIQGTIIQRKQQRLQLTIKQYLQKQFNRNISNAKVKTHSVTVTPQTTLKQCLQQWNYNDGFCYFMIQF